MIHTSCVYLEIIINKVLSKQLIKPYFLVVLFENLVLRLLTHENLIPKQHSCHRVLNLNLFFKL